MYTESTSYLVNTKPRIPKEHTKARNRMLPLMHYLYCIGNCTRLFFAAIPLKSQLQGEITMYEDYDELKKRAEKQESFMVGFVFITILAVVVYFCAMSIRGY